ncbi:glycosyltransferase [Actinomadura sp. ATCC 31491]|uniref:Glycosyltransferase n=1 Tax=Actinomadura luzonensis TaxID=2805427 RepID=A0ABT0GCA5_9ACTN|nr:glycosyltransferase family 2 protein [Actinomadura luzonensis]MCK2221731.1 glycosyltransferase [Actinomadura luzonensis]
MSGPLAGRDPGPRIRHNDYGVLRPPAPGTWRPSMTVSVVIPARDCAEALERTLAALARQTYPAELVEVVVADDGSEPPLEAPGARVVRVRDGWGRGAARQAGQLAATGEVVLWLDADMLPADDHVEAHMRWHHLLGYAVVMGETRFVREPGEEGEQSAYVRERLAATDRLRRAGSGAYLLHTGASASVRAGLLRAAGGVDVTLNMAEDTELGYRLAQAGAVFVPDAEARARHVGPSTVMLREKEVHRHNWSYLGDLIPDLRWLRSHPRRCWRVPYVEVVVTAGGYEETRASVDSALAGTLPDAAVTLVGPWGRLTGERRASLDDPVLDLRLLHNLYAHEPRVAFAEGVAPSAAPTPFRLRLPTGWVLGADTLARLVEHAGGETLGLVSAALAEGRDGVVAARLERTAAFSRAALFPGAPDDLVHEMYGSEWVSGAEYGFATAEEAEPLGGDPAKWRALAGRRLGEIKELTRTVERLRAEVERLSAAEPQEEDDGKGPLAALIRQLRSAG